MQFSYNLGCINKRRFHMENNKYVKPHSLLRMFAALLAVVVFVSMFIAKQIVHANFENVFCTWIQTYFGGDGFKGSVFGFIGYIFIFLGGLAGLAFVFIDEMIGKDLTKKLSFVAGGLMLLGALFIFLTGVFFRAFNSDGFGMKDYHLAAGPIVFGVLAAVGGACNVAAPILEDKGF